MIDEAKKCGLAVDPSSVNQLAWGVQRKDSPFSYVAPDIRQDPHHSMTFGWRLLEWLPKSDKYKEWQARRSLLGHYIPDAEPRPIPEDAFVHESVVDRMRAVPEYQPVNMPARYRTIPMPSGPHAE
jgi:hypothetical protein